jgi:hypothetical protein
MADLFTLEQLASYLQRDLDEATATVARTAAQGMLQTATALTDWPTPVPGDLFGWGLELAGLLYDNPLSTASEQVDDYRIAYVAGRRDQILRGAMKAYNTGGQPQYSFPDADWHWDAVPVQSAEVA